MPSSALTCSLRPRAVQALPTRHDSASGEALGPGRADAHQAFVSCLAAKLMARSTRYLSGYEFVFTEAEVTVSREAWERIRDMSREMGKLINDEAVPCATRGHPDECHPRNVRGRDPRHGPANMSGGYREVLRTSGALRDFVPALVGRFSFASLAFAFAAGFCRIAALTAQPDPSLAALVGPAVIIGLFPPPLGPSMRVLWGSPIAPGALRTKAHSIDAVCEELLFTTGPLFAAAILSAASPTIGLPAPATVAPAGTLGMTSSSLSRQHVAVPASSGKGSRP